MSSIENTYETDENITATGIQHLFFSERGKDILKVIEYSYVQELNGRSVYNLGFGVYDPKTDTVSDDINTNNGDHYRVLNTVLNTIPNFFNIYKNAMLMVQGSDSIPEFIEKCKLT